MTLREMLRRFRVRFGRDEWEIELRTAKAFHTQMKNCGNDNDTILYILNKRDEHLEKACALNPSLNEGDELFRIVFGRHWKREKQYHDAL